MKARLRRLPCADIRRDTGPPWAAKLSSNPRRRRPSPLVPTPPRPSRAATAATGTATRRRRRRRHERAVRENRSSRFAERTAACDEDQLANSGKRTKTKFTLLRCRKQKQLQLIFYFERKICLRDGRMSPNDYDGCVILFIQRTHVEQKPKKHARRRQRTNRQAERTVTGNCRTGRRDRSAACPAPATRAWRRPLERDTGRCTRVPPTQLLPLKKYEEPKLLKFSDLWLLRVNCITLRYVILYIFTVHNMKNYKRSWASYQMNEISR